MKNIFYRYAKNMGVAKSLFALKIDKSVKKSGKKFYAV